MQDLETAIASITPAVPVDPASRRAGGLSAHRVRTVLAYIDEHFAEPICVQHLASQVHMSPFHFARMFKISVGHPPHAYITNVRIERAKRLLADTHMALADVACRVGYQTQAHFTGVFHKHVGTTPRAYRLAAQASRGERPQ